MIIIYSKQKDEFVNEVIDYLQNEPFFRISKGNGFEYISSILEIQSKGNSSSLIKNSYTKAIDIQKLNSVWFNGGSLNLSNDHRGNTNELNELLFQNLNLIIEGILGAGKTKKIGNVSNNKKTNKIYNLLVAKNIDLKIPETLITKNKEELQSFVDAHNKHGVICKRVNESDSFSEKNYLFDNSKTFLITQTILDKYPNIFGTSLFQQRIKKKFEIRATYFNNTFYSSAIFDISDNVDYRENLQSSSNKPRIIPYILPTGIETKLKKLVDRLNYTFCSVDLMYSDKGEYIFLESGKSKIICISCIRYFF